jgi:hypothetical protein
MITKSAALLALIVLGWLAMGPSQARADTGEIVSALLAICVGGGSEQKLEADGKVDVAQGQSMSFVIELEWTASRDSG